jgi:hypothetical protein
MNTRGVRVHFRKAHLPGFTSSVESGLAFFPLIEEELTLLKDSFRHC